MGGVVLPNERGGVAPTAVSVSGILRERAQLTTVEDKQVTNSYTTAAVAGTFIS